MRTSPRPLPMARGIAVPQLDLLDVRLAREARPVGQDERIGRGCSLRPAHRWHAGVAGLVEQLGIGPPGSAACLAPADELVARFGA